LLQLQHSDPFLFFEKKLFPPQSLSFDELGLLLSLLNGVGLLKPGLLDHHLFFILAIDEVLLSSLLNDLVL
jgi:hypothetical protein